MASSPVRSHPTLTHVQTLLIITSVSGVTLLTSFLSGAVTISLPTIASSLGISDQNLEWPVSMYSLVNGTFLLVAGGLADTLGRKTLFLVGTATFAIVSLAVSFARNSLSFILLMSLLGLAPAILSPSGAGILGGTFPEGRTKTIAFASLGAGQPIGFIMGLVSGGILSSKWRSLYWLLSGLSASLGVIAVFSLPPDVRLTRAQTVSQLRAFDWIGAVLSAVGAVSLIFALSDAGSAPNGWSTPYIPALLPTSATFVISFLWWEEKRERDNQHVLLPLSLWRAKGLGTMITMIFFAWAAFNTLSYLATLTYQQVQQTSPIGTAIYFLPMCASGFILNVLAGNLTGKVSTFKLISAGLLLSTGACLAFSLLSPNANYAAGMLWVMLLSVGPDLFFSAANIHIQNSVGEDKQALAGSLFMMSTRFATSFGLAVCSAISTATTRRSQQHLLATHTPSDTLSSRALLDGLRAAGWACLVFTVLSFAVALFGLRETEMIAKRDVDEQPTADPRVSADEERNPPIELHATSPALEMPLDKVSLYSFRSRAGSSSLRTSSLGPAITHD